ncbi:MAG: glycosyltransferase family 2 protein [Thermoguttaceae bacterium]
MASNYSPIISIVVPVYNEEAGLVEFYESVSNQLEQIGLSWEIVFVNDGSKDQSEMVLRQLHERDFRVKFLSFSRNFGHQIAITAGSQHASGRAVITMDADLQHPPSMIPEMVALWSSGYHVVYTIRTYGDDTSLFKRKTSELFYQTINKISDIKFVPGAADFRLLDRKVVDYLNSMPENSKFVRGMVSWLGFKQIGVPYLAAARKTGVSKYTLKKMVTFALDGISSFSTKPLRWISYFGISVALLGVLFACQVLFETLFLGGTAPGWPTIMITVLILSGAQLISLGVIGEYIGKIYMETKRRPPYVIDERIGFADSDETKK